MIANISKIEYIFYLLKEGLELEWDDDYYANLVKKCIIKKNDEDLLNVRKEFQGQLN
jgi:hypothetical protein